jgi:hypothetical protein
MIIESIGVVWGKKYIDNFFKYTLPYFITNKNIYYINQKKLILNVIFKKSEKNIVDIYPKKKFLNIIYYPDFIFNKNKYEVHSAIIKKFIKKINSSSYIFLMYPDQIISDEFFKILLSDNNYSLYFKPGLKIKLNNENRKFIKRNLIRGITSKKLTKFIINNLHIKMKLMTINDSYFNNAPAWIIYKTDKTLITKSFHLTPLLIKNQLIKNSNFNVKKGIDDYISSNFLTKKIKFFENSKKISWASYEAENINNHINFKYSKNFFYSIKWIKSCTTDYQKYLFIKYTYLLSNNYESTNYFIKFKFFLILFLNIINLINLSYYLLTLRVKFVNLFRNIYNLFFSNTLVKR